MNGDADLPHRSSSPLKRRASSMEPEGGTHLEGPADAQVASSLPRDMSVDPPEQNGVAGPDNTQPNGEWKAVATKRSWCST